MIEFDMKRVVSLICIHHMTIVARVSLCGEKVLVQLTFVRGRCGEWPLHGWGACRKWVKAQDEGTLMRAEFSGKGYKWQCSSEGL